MIPDAPISNLSKAMLGNKNGFKKGYTPWNKGRHIRTVNRSYFKTWSQNMAYILGYIASDGCLYTRENGIKIVSKDKDILDAISNELDSTYPVGSHSANAHQIQIYSSEMYADLMTLGLTPNKSLTLKHPNIPAEYLRHFIRGVFDGDGCIARNRKSPRVSIVSSSHDFIQSLKSSLESIGIVEGHIYVKKPGICNKQTVPCYELSLRKHDSIRFYSIIYSGASIYLQRKKEKFDNILEDVIYN